MRAISGKTEEELNQLAADDLKSLAATAALFPDAMEQSELGNIPKGWKVGTLSELCSLNPESWNTKTLPNTVRYVDLANTKNGEILELQTVSGKNIPCRARRILKLGDTIIGTVRPGNRSFALIGEPNLTASTGFAVLRPLADKWREFVYFSATSETNIERLAHRADGAAYPAVRPEVVIQEVVIIPSTQLVQTFHQSSIALFSKVILNKKQIKTLTNLRNTLLPKLLSGELQLPPMHEQVIR